MKKPKYLNARPKQKLLTCTQISNDNVIEDLTTALKKYKEAC
jgi:hypothetical protein